MGGLDINSWKISNGPSKCGSRGSNRATATPPCRIVYMSSGMAKLERRKRGPKRTNGSHSYRQFTFIPTRVLSNLPSLHFKWVSSALLSIYLVGAP